MSKIRIGLQIESTSPLVRQLIGSGKGVSEWDGIDPDEIVKVTHTVESSNIQEINPGIYYNIPSITTAKQGDTLFSDDGRLFVYDEAGSRWFLWYTFDNSSVKIHTNNTLKGEGTLDDPLTVNATVVALKGDLNPLLEGTDNGDGTYTFTSVDGSTMFTVDVGDRFVTHIDDLRNTSGRYDGDRIDVIGYYIDTPGKGGGRFYWDASSTDGDNGGTIIQSNLTAAGRWKRKYDGVVNAYWFGLRGEGVIDETSQLQAFFDHIGSVNYDAAIIEGNYRISSTVVIGQLGGGSYLTTIIEGSPRFESTGAIDTMLRFYGIRLIQVKGIWTVIGTTIRSYSTRRTRREGVRIEGCREGKFAGFRCMGFGDSGVVFEGASLNNNMAYIGFVEGVNIGSGAPKESWTNSLTANWSNPVNSGASNSIGQYTEIDVDVMPDPTEREYICVYIDNEYYLVRVQDSINNKLRVFPQIPASVTPGMLVYHYGAAITITGTDSNVLEIGSINATRCGSALDIISPYGPTIDRIVAQVCGALATIGRETSSVMDTININLAYYEDNTSDIIFVPEGGFSSWVFGANINLALSKVHKIVRLDNLNPTNRFVVNYNGSIREWEKHSNNWRNTRDTTAIGFSQPNRVYTLRRNSVTILLSPNEDLNRLFGYDTVWVAIQGSGNNNSPSGVIYFQSQRGDGSYRNINGQNSSVPIEFSTFPGPAMFVCHWHVSSDQLFVSPVATIPTPSEIGALQPGDDITELNNNGVYLNETSHDALPADNPHSVNIQQTYDEGSPASTSTPDNVLTTEAGVVKTTPILSYNVFNQNIRNSVNVVGTTETTILSPTIGSLSLTTNDCAANNSYELEIIGELTWGGTTTGVNIILYVGSQTETISIPLSNTGTGPIKVEAKLDFLDGIDTARTCIFTGNVIHIDDTGTTVYIPIPETELTVDVSSGTTFDATFAGTDAIDEITVSKAMLNRVVS